MIRTTRKACGSTKTEYLGVNTAFIFQIFTTLFLIIFIWRRLRQCRHGTHKKNQNNR